MTFLRTCAEYLHTHYADRAAQTCVILPTRRSSLVLARELALLGFAPNTPEVIDIERFVGKTTGIEPTNPVLLLLELFEVFAEFDKEIKLERFTGWGYILLKDFDAIDKNLVDADLLFRNLLDIKNIERWKLGADRITPKIKDYFQLWENLSHTYHEFRKRLNEADKAYSGMTYRHLAENIDSLLLQHPRYQHYVFVGFNALSESEAHIFQTLDKHGKADFLWDTDEYYMQPDTENRAGHFLRQYRRSWAKNHWKFETDTLRHAPKEIEVIEVANASMQGKVANQILHNWQSQRAESQAATALVLADEQLLTPVLHSLGEDFAGLNISIGLSLKDSAIFNLADILFDQYQSTIRDRQTEEIKFSHRTIAKLLNHPFVRQYEKRHCNPAPEGEDEGRTESKSLLLLLLQHINRHNLIFLSQAEILDLHHQDDFRQQFVEEAELISYCEYASEVMRPLLEVLFTRWRNTFQVLECLERLTELLQAESNFLENAYFLEFGRILQDLKGFVMHRPERIDIKTFKIFLYQAFREAKFEFEGNLNTPLQLMGMPETRNLDFERLIVLSVNETILPRAKKMNSFIPLDVAQSFGLPTYSEQDAVVSYHFYRLLQRAQEIALVHVAPSDTYGGKERSRFLWQLENDLQALNPQLRLRQRTARFRTQGDMAATPLTFEKDAVNLAKMRENFRRGLTPTHINDYLTCTLRYYFNQIADIGRTMQVQETLGADKIGSIIHEILEEMIREIADKKTFVEVSDIEWLLPSVEPRVEEKFSLGKYSRYELTGENYMAKQATVQLLNKFLRQQISEIEKEQTPFEILALENRLPEDDQDKPAQLRLTAQIEIMVNGEPITLTLSGITDRIDKVKKKVRIVDYKTGKINPSEVKLGEYDQEKLLRDREAGKVRQLWLYKFIVAKGALNHGEAGFPIGTARIRQDDDISAGFYSLRNTEHGFIEIQPLKKDSASLFANTLQEYVEQSEEFLGEILTNMLDETQPFTRTDNLKDCEYCAYKDICGRG